ncbi:hypothetical protein [Paenibacillus aestuarii]|uniref:Uncharacterized protein n=1 Tax=Paenibacillus aestuarii TaxID=516965 RepID=A0ABW0K144_9BACL|nr:hypothetical protein [Paenibacillus aestuarii]
MNEMTSGNLESDQSFTTRFQQIFEQSISLIVYFTEIFLKELETSYPDWYDRLIEAMNQREEHVLAFYEDRAAPIPSRALHRHAGIDP